MIAILRNNAVMLAGALIVVLLQVFVAPYITIGFAMVNFIMCYVILMAIFRAEKQGYVMPFILGLIYDLVSTGCVGAMALVCVLLTFSISRIYMLLANDTVFFPMILIVCGCFLGEAVYGGVLIVCGLDVSLLQALIYRVLPCGLYDTVVSVLAYLMMARFLYSTERYDSMQVIR